MSESESESEKQCEAEAAGYDGWFGIYCTRPSGHDGYHRDDYVEWRFVDESMDPRAE